MPDLTRDTPEILLERIDARLAELGRSRYWLDKEVTGGKSTKVVTEIARKRSIPKEPRLTRIAEVLGLSTEYLLGRTADPEPMRSEVEIGGSIASRSDMGASSVAVDPIPVLGTGDCADLEVCTVDNRTLRVERSSFDEEFPVRYIKRPPALANRRDIYAIYYRGESMEPRFYAGEVGLVDPRQPPSNSDFVLVQLTNGQEDTVVTVLVKQLVRQNAQEIVLAQFNPPAEFVIPRSTVLRIHRILPPTDLLFG